MRVTGPGTAMPSEDDRGARLSRRTVLKAGLLGGALLAIDACVPPGTGRSTRYGLLGPPDANGLQMPPGFSSRIVARSGVPVGPSGYTWHGAPDGGRCFPAPGGWIYVSNSEIDVTGGVGMLRFDLAGSVVDARR